VEKSALLPTRQSQLNITTPSMNHKATSLTYQNDKILLLCSANITLLHQQMVMQISFVICIIAESNSSASRF
jgi:hypothetical protein